MPENEGQENNRGENQIKEPPPENKTPVDKAKTRQRKAKAKPKTVAQTDAEVPENRYREEGDLLIPE